MQGDNNALKKNTSRDKILEILIDLFDNFKDLKGRLKYKFIYRSIYRDISIKNVLKTKNQRALLTKIYLSRF